MYKLFVIFGVLFVSFNDACKTKGGVSYSCPAGYCCPKAGTTTGYVCEGCSINTFTGKTITVNPDNINDANVKDISYIALYNVNSYLLAAAFGFAVLLSINIIWCVYKICTITTSAKNGKYSPVITDTESSANEL
mmetsp:Transcript_103894/g.126969  ORF Transcript_103894/g.126969 Transcript_103894/m.126969 type:complete len:135 (+) Transcript_103894:57-461(+)